MKKIMKKIIFLLLAIFVPAIICCVIFTSSKISVCGKMYLPTEKEIKFSGEEIKSIDELDRDLYQLAFLKKVDLGNYEISPEEASILQNNHPNVEFCYYLRKKLSYLSYSTKSEYLDLFYLENTSIDELIVWLNDFKNAKEVKINDKIITPFEFDSLCNAFPFVKFDVLVKRYIFGVEALSNVTFLDLSKAEIDESIISELAYFDKLQSVDIHNAKISDEEKLLLTKTYPDIRFLMSAKILGKTHDSNENKFQFSDIDNIDFDEFKNELNLFKNSISEIEMCDTNLTNEQMAELCEAFPKIKFVWRLYMGQWSLKTNDLAFSVLIYDFEHTRLTSKDIEVLKYCTDLKALDLGHQAITDISVIGDYLPDLRILILADNQITDISPISKLKHLHYLELFVNRITDLTPLSECREIVDINIGYNHKLSDISVLSELPLLERIWLEHMPVSQNDVDKLREKFPEALIFNVGEGSVDNGWREHERYNEMIKLFHGRIQELPYEFTKYEK